MKKIKKKEGWHVISESDRFREVVSVYADKKGKIIGSRTFHQEKRNGDWVNKKY